MCNNRPRSNVIRIHPLASKPDNNKQAYNLTEKDYMERAKYLKKLMSLRRKTAHSSLKDIVTILKAVETGNYTEAYTTRLYNIHGAEYCEYLELIRTCL